MNRPESHPTAGRAVRQIVVTFADGEALTLEHQGEGEVVDALVWSEALMKKLRYEDEQQPGRCVRPEQTSGNGWKKRGRGAAGGTEGGKQGETSLMSASGNGGDPECVYVHTTSCTWRMICDQQ